MTFARDRAAHSDPHRESVERDQRAMNIAIIGGGPAGLMAAEAALAGGARVDLYDSMASVGGSFC